MIALISILAVLAWYILGLIPSIIIFKENIAHPVEGRFRNNYGYDRRTEEGNQSVAVIQCLLLALLGGLLFILCVTYLAGVGIYQKPWPIIRSGIVKLAEML